jgi:thioesterase domain-containing protein/peptidoglycan/xylan/chitin deacetylase (PgdA/CDA1 family)
MDKDVPRLLRGTPELPPRCVALTFDDGPGPKSAELASLLREQDVPGTFFVLGESVERYGHVLEAYRDCGHVIGLHGDRHNAFRSIAHAADELSRCAERVGPYLGDTAWFRPPYGIGDWPVPGFVGPVGWHAQGRDWDITYRRERTVDACVESIAGQLIRRDGGIALLHDFAAASEFVPAGLTEADLNLRIVEITTLLIERLRGAGFSFIALPEPAAAHTTQRPQAQPPQAQVTGQTVAAVPETTPRPRPTLGLAGSETLQTLRLFRSTAKAAGGTLDLVMPMRISGDGPALFCAHPMVGLSWCYLAMLPHVDPRYQLYGLQARGLRRPEPLPTSMEEMARDYADQIRMTQPSGPYHLLGWSLGSYIAFAIAQELERRGEQIGLFVNMDANWVDLEGIESNEPWMVYNLVLAQFGYVPALTAADSNPAARMLELVRRRPGLGLDEWPEKRLRALQRVINNNVAMARTFKPGRVHCSLLLFFSACQNDPPLAEKLDNWRPFVDAPMEAIELDCNHRHMLLPEPVARLGPALSDALGRVDAAIKSPIVQLSSPV